MMSLYLIGALLLSATPFMPTEAIPDYLVMLSMLGAFVTIVHQIELKEENEGDSLEETTY
jgi:hypothetical protein